jgi:tetratricopeptide (TPR) repeat protein
MSAGMTRARVITVAFLLLVVVAAGLIARDRAGAAALPEPDAARLFQQGNEAYERGDFAAAVTSYRQILEGGREIASLHYNLGNAYLKIGELGEALSSYRRAERMSPRSADLRENLAVARARRADLAAPGALSPIAALRDAISHALSLRSLEVLADLLYYGAVALGVMLLVGGGGRVVRRVLYVVAPLAAVSLLLTYAEIRDRALARDAVLVVPQAEARSGPGPEYTALFTIHEGAEFAVEDERRAWCMISMGGNLHGWVPRELLEKVSEVPGPPVTRTEGGTAHAPA